MNNFLNFILLGKGMTIRMNIGRRTSLDERDGMIMDSTRRGKGFGDGKTNLVVGEDRLEVGMHKMCLNNMNGVELGYNSRMTFLEEIFHVMGTNDLWGARCDALELILLSLLLELHGQVLKIHENGA
jgi:hypothetical protein